MIQEARELIEAIRCRPFRGRIMKGQFSTLEKTLIALAAIGGLFLIVSTNDVDTIEKKPMSWTQYQQQKEVK